MRVDMENLVSLSEANQNFSRVARMVDERGSVVILRNNVPRYVLVDYDNLLEDETATDDEVLEASRRLFGNFHSSYEELAK